MNSTSCTRCGAFWRRIPRSFNASITSEMLPCSRYRTPPCTSFVLRLDVPLQKSSRSSSSTAYPRFAASTAIPAPVAPPPITTISQGSLRSLTRTIISSRFIVSTRPHVLPHPATSPAAPALRPDPLWVQRWCPARAARQSRQSRSRILPPAQPGRPHPAP